jgi:hypothetical protein
MIQSPVRHFRGLFRSLHTLLDPRSLQVAGCRSRGRLRPFRPCLEALEQRTVLATLTVGPNVNISKAAGNNAESTISINPTNPLNLFEDDTFSTVGHFSVNGGTTWLKSNMAGIPATVGDVQSAWDKFGNLFLVELTANVPNQTVILALSTDGGASFRSLGNPLPTDTNVGFDQPSIAVGPGATPTTGSVWISTTDGLNNLVAVGAPVLGLGSLGAFGAPEVAPGPGGDFGSVAVGSNGQVLVTYQDNGSGEGPDSIKVNLDPDGLGPAGFNPVVIATPTNVGGFTHLPAQPSRGIDAEANLAWDRSGGPHNGRVYLVYTDRPSTSSADTDIFVRFSDNNGTTWSNRVRVNDDPLNNGKSQLQPALAVDQTTGNLAVTWYDTRNSGATNDTTQVFGAVSFDGGVTFTANVQISAGTSNASVADPGFELGDYDLMDFSNGVFYRTWADNSNSTGDNPDGTTALDIYTAKVTVPSGTTNPPSVTLPANQTTAEGAAQAFNLGSFTDSLSGPWTGTVNWGDGSTSPLSIAGPGSLGTQMHPYTEEGTFTLTVTVTNVSNGQSGPGTSQVTVSDPAVVPGSPFLFVAVHGVPLNNQNVTTFTDPGGPELNPNISAHYLAIIVWGDQTSPVLGTISFSNGTFTVTGSHTYATNGVFIVITVLVNEGAPFAFGVSLAVVVGTAGPASVPQGQTDAPNGISIAMADATPASTAAPGTATALVDAGANTLLFGGAGGSGRPAFTPIIEQARTVGAMPLVQTAPQAMYLGWLLPDNLHRDPFSPLVRRKPYESRDEQGVIPVTISLD